MMEIYNTIYDIVFSSDYSLIFRMMIIIVSFSMMINVFRYVISAIGSGGSGYEDDSESDNFVKGKKVDLTKKNNMFTKYYDHYDKD